MNPVVSQTDSFVNQLNWHTNQSTKALEQLAGGTRLQAPQDDAAGLAVATKLEAQLRQFDAAARNLANATSFTQTQDTIDIFSSYQKGIYCLSIWISGL